MKKFPRVFTAMITPFKEDGSVNFEGAQQLARHLAFNGSPGIVVGGTTGESPTLSKTEKLDLFASVKEAVGADGVVFAGTGSNSTYDSAQLTEEASRLGIDGIMAVTPYYNKPSQAGLYQHFKTIAGVTDLPVLLYNVPGRTGVNMLPETVAKLAQLKNVAALKEACGNTDQVSALKGLVSADFLIYSGDDSLTLPMLAVGAYGVVSVASHAAATQIAQMIDEYVSGNIQAACKTHLALYPLFKAMFITTNPVPVKCAVSLLGLPSSAPRLPLVEASAEEEAIIRKALTGAGLIS